MHIDYRTPCACLDGAFPKAWGGVPRGYDMLLHWGLPVRRADIMFLPVQRQRQQIIQTEFGRVDLLRPVLRTQIPFIAVLHRVYYGSWFGDIFRRIGAADLQPIIVMRNGKRKQNIASVILIV